MRRIFAICATMMLVATLYSQPQIYLGARGGAGVVLNRGQLKGVETSEGFKNAIINNKGRYGSVKGEALLGLGRFRLGYRFMYNYSNSQGNRTGFSPQLSGDKYTLYLSNSRTHIFGHYAVLELAVLNLKHFALTPAIAAGGFTGYTKDDVTDFKARMVQGTKRRFSIGAELNFEIKVNRFVFLIGPNYYLFNQEDKIHANWKKYTHIIGADLGLRVNFIKPRG